MGVLNCSRNGCEEIMCDRYNDKYGYICYECFDELKQTKDQWDSVVEFMESEKGCMDESEELQNLEEIFKERQ